MNWETYEPLSMETVLRFEDYVNVIQGDMFGGQPDDPDDNDLYLITHIDEDIFAFNYTKGQFEHLPKSVVRGWIENDRVFRPILSSRAFTIEAEDGTPVGVRAVGVADQTEKMVKEFGSDVFGFTIGLVFEEDLPATEIQEPYKNDITVTHPSFNCFIDKALTELSEEITERTAIGSDYSKELVKGLLRDLEQNVRARPSLNLDSDPVLVDPDEDLMEINGSDENSRNFFFSEDSDENQVIELHGHK